MKNFHKTIYLILSTLLGILYVQNTIYKVFLKVINEHLLEGDFTRSVGGLEPNHKKADCSQDVSNTGVQLISKCLKQPINVKQGL